nr:hypothetical protein [Tanacetum cinerariifolium]
MVIIAKDVLFSERNLRKICLLNVLKMEFSKILPSHPMTIPTLLMLFKSNSLSKKTPVKDNKENDKIRTKPDKIKSKREAWKSLESSPTKSKPSQSQESIKQRTESVFGAAAGENCPKCGHPVTGHYCQGCALLRKKFKEDLFTSCIENGILQDSSEPSNDNTNVVNAPREPFVVNQDPGKNSSQSPPQINHHCCYSCDDPLEGIFCHKCTCKLCENGAHYGYNCPPKVSIIPNLEPFNNQTIKEPLPTVQSFDPKSDLVHDSLNVFDPPPQFPFIPCEFYGNDARYGHYCTPQVPFVYLEPCYNQDFNFSQDFHDFQQQDLCCENCGVTHEAYQCQPKNKDYYHEQNSCYDHNSFEQLASMYDMVGQFVQKKEQEKQIEEEQAANARYWKIPACYDDDDDDYAFAITPNEPDNSLSMGDEHLDTILAMESDEFIKSSVENLVPNPCESEGDNECDVTAYAVFTTFSNLLFESDYDFYSKIDETDCYPEEETHFIKRLLYDNSSPRPSEEFVFENSDAKIKSFSLFPIPAEVSDSLMEEIGLSFTLDYPMPPEIKEDDYDSERDILILDELLSNNSLSLPEKESFHLDIPSLFCPLAKPPDGDTGILNVKMMGDISKQKQRTKSPFNNQTIDELPQTLPSFDPTSYSEDGNSFTYDSTSNLVNDSPNDFGPPLQPLIYSYEFCGNDAYHGHDCSLQVPFTYDPKPYSSAHQVGQASNLPEKNKLKNVNIKLGVAVHGASGVVDRIDREEGSVFGVRRKSFSAAAVVAGGGVGKNKEANIDTQPFQYFVVPQPPQEDMSVGFLQEKRNQMDSVKTFLRKFNQISFYKLPKVLSIAWETILEIELAFEDKHCQPEDILELFQRLYNDVQNIHEELAVYINTPNWDRPTICSDDDNEDDAIAVTPSLLSEEPDNSLSMGTSILTLFQATESDEFIKSSVESLVPIPSESEGILDNMCDMPFHDNSPPLDVSKDQFEDFSDSNDDSTSNDDDSFSIDNIEYVEASPPNSELVSSEVMEIVIPEVGGIDDDILLTIKDDILREKLLNINLLIATIEALNDNPTPSFDFMTKSSSTSLNSLLEETNTFDNSLPEFEIFCFDLEEISSGSTTTRFDISLLEYEAFYDDHVKEISSGSTITHSDSSLYDSFIFDLSINPFSPADRSDFYEFADDLTHIISPPEYDCFFFKNEPNSGDFTMDVVEDIPPTREPRVHNALPTHPTLQLNLDFILYSESLFAYVVWIFLPFLSYSVSP